ncbi:MAG: hypothetical protein KJ964_03965 [Verrucomicrobia bacterium]|nr:hypothetical protein [Verrucomicrobiota bacterium]MBU1736034.1 hypothetical protein [Verrucomicrobiota bacterium]MBU1858130.1 hypothetical protein [Verrucomicrobiota bacterium]
MTDNGSAHDPADAPPSNDDLKSQTSRISLESARPLKSPLEVKKATGLVPGIPAVGPIPQTIRLKRPPTSPITVQPVDLQPAVKKASDTALVQAPTTVRAATAETVKRQTSRIGLAESMAPKGPTDFKRTTGPILGIPTHAGPIPQTIRLKRPVTSPAKRPPTSPVIAKPSEPSVMPRVEPVTRGGQDTTEAPTVIKHIAAPKTPTSRIVLEELSEPVSATTKPPTTNIPPLTSAEPPAPKTIRLKRPSTLSDAEETIQVIKAEESLRTAGKGETAKIDLPLEDSSLTPITQRKTIKIKRTDRTVTPRSATPEAAAAPEPGALVEAPAPEEEETFAFPLVAVAATLCIAALVYIMVAQAFGVHLLLPSSMQLH